MPNNKESGWAYSAMMLDSFSKIRYQPADTWKSWRHPEFHANHVSSPGTPIALSSLGHLVEKRFVSIPLAPKPTILMGLPLSLSIPLRPKVWMAAFTEKPYLICMVLTPTKSINGSQDFTHKVFRVNDYLRSSIDSDTSFQAFYLTPNFSVMLQSRRLCCCVGKEALSFAV